MLNLKTLLITITTLLATSNVFAESSTLMTCTIGGRYRMQIVKTESRDTIKQEFTQANVIDLKTQAAMPSFLLNVENVNVTDTLTIRGTRYSDKKSNGKKFSFFTSSDSDSDTLSMVLSKKSIVKSSTEEGMECNPTVRLPGVDLVMAFKVAGINDTGNSILAVYKTRDISCFVGNSDGESNRKSTCSIVPSNSSNKPVKLSAEYAVDFYSAISKVLRKGDTKHMKCNEDSSNCALMISGLSCEGSVRSDYLDCTVNP